MFYFSTIWWLRFQQETKWVNINFERTDLTSAQISHLSTDDFGEIFAFNLTKQNVTFVVHPKNLNLNCSSILHFPAFASSSSFYEHSNEEERDEWVRLLDKLYWLKM